MNIGYFKKTQTFQKLVEIERNQVTLDARDSAAVAGAMLDELMEASSQRHKGGSWLDDAMVRERAFKKYEDAWYKRAVEFLKTA